MRPTLMPSLAFPLGLMPLAIAAGAGSASQNEIGIAVIGGMLAATFLGPLLVPMFFEVVSRKLGGRSKPEPAAAMGPGKLHGALRKKHPRVPLLDRIWRDCPGEPLAPRPPAGG